MPASLDGHAGQPISIPSVSCERFEMALKAWKEERHKLLGRQVLGNAKGVAAATISVALFRNPVTSMGLAGYSITVAGVVAYSQVHMILFTVNV